MSVSSLAPPSPTAVAGCGGCGVTRSLSAEALRQLTRRATLKRAGTRNRSFKRSGPSIAQLEAIQKGQRVLDARLKACALFLRATTDVNVKCVPDGTCMFPRATTDVECVPGGTKHKDLKMVKAHGTHVPWRTKCGAHILLQKELAPGRSRDKNKLVEHLLLASRKQNSKVFSLVLYCCVFCTEDI